MALIKSKQIASVDVAKIIESTSKQFVSNTEKTAIAAVAGKQEALGFVPVDSAIVGAANGIATLDSNQKILISQLPDLTGSVTKVVADTAAMNALTGMKAGDQCVVLVSSDGSRDGFIYDGAAWLKDSDTDWANVDLNWSNVAGAPVSTPAAIDAAVTKVATLKNGFVKTITMSPAASATTINTGIMTNGTTANYTNYPELTLAVNGFAQAEGAGKDFTVSVISNELVIAWLNRGFALEADDELVIGFTQAV